MSVGSGLECERTEEYEVKIWKHGFMKWSVLMEIMRI